MSDVNENQPAAAEAAKATEGRSDADATDDGGVPTRAGSPSVPDEATHSGPPPDGADDVHELTTAAPEQSAMGDDPEATDPAAGEPGAASDQAAGGDHPEDEIGAGGVGVGTEEKGIRVPPPQDPPRPIHHWPMRSAIGAGELVLLEDEDVAPDLTLPEGPLGEAELALAQGDIEKANRLVQPLLPSDDKTALDAASGGALGMVIRGALMGGDLDTAKKLIDPRRDDDHLAVADAAYSLAMGQQERARKRIDVAIKRNGTGLPETYTLALVRVAEGEMELARELLTNVSRSSPEHAVARHQLGQLVLAAGDPARAGTLFEQAIQLAPSFVPPALSLAEMLSDSRQYGEAMQLLSNLTEEHPGLLAPRLVQLRILLTVGDLETAGTLADALRKAAPGVPEMELLWAESSARRGDLDGARKALLDLVSGGAGVSEKALRLLAQLELSNTPSDYAAAIGYLNQALADAPNSAELLLETAQAHLSAGDMTSARERLEAIGALAHVDLGVLLSASVAAQNHGLFRTAIDLAEGALGQVRGTPAEAQISAFIAQLQGA